MLHLSPLFSFTLYALLSMSSVVARPVRGGHDVYVPAARRSFSDVDLLADFLSRRTKATGSRSRASSTSSTKSLTSKRICIPGVAKRSYFEESLYSRTASGGSSSDEEQITLKDLDPQTKHLITAPLVMASASLGGGSYGSVYPDPNDPTHVIKHVGGHEKVTVGMLHKEVKYLKLATQFKDFKYTLVDGKVKEGWIWIKRIDGKTIEQLGLFTLKSAKPETTDFAKAHARGSPARKTFMDDLVNKIVHRALDYAQKLGVEHLDMNENNVMIRMNGAKIESVDLIDWGIAQTIACTPETEANLRKEILKDFEPYY